VKLILFDVITNLNSF